jgi:hypothetical protein
LFAALSLGTASVSRRAITQQRLRVLNAMANPFNAIANLLLQLSKVFVGVVHLPPRRGAPFHSRRTQVANFIPASWAFAFNEGTIPFTSKKLRRLS